MCKVEIEHNTAFLRVLSKSQPVKEDFRPSWEHTVLTYMANKTFKTVVRIITLGKAAPFCEPLLQYISPFSLYHYISPKMFDSEVGSKSNSVVKL